MLETRDSGATNLRISLATGKPLPRRGLTYSTWQPRHLRREGESLCDRDFVQAGLDSAAEK